MFESKKEKISKNLTENLHETIPGRINVSEIKSDKPKHDFVNNFGNPLTHKTLANLENLKH
jgi:hypothetical protein